MTGVGSIGAAVGLVVEADVAAGDRHVERPAGFADAGDRLRELPHDLGPFCGLPKFRQFVAPIGSPPAQATLRAASATASFAPWRGSRSTNRPLPSTDIASARSVPFTRTTLAPMPGSMIVFVRTM